jgi:adenylate/guanylate cyclase family protein/double zinc ribbon protein
MPAAMDNAIRCLRCDAENRPGRRFCAACGAVLPRACSACGFLNDADERFCGGCGAAIEAQPAAANAPGAGRAMVPQDVSERRQVSILFADLSGYTSLAARRDPEETHRILGRFFEAVDHAVTRYGGSIERHIGDNVMGVFGAPVAHGDDPYRAVEAAREIHRVVGEVSADIGIALAVHIGIAAGTVMASSTGSSLKAAYGVVGGPVNLALVCRRGRKPAKRSFPIQSSRRWSSWSSSNPWGRLRSKGSTHRRAYGA